jgi:hypothetical protein
MSITNNNDSGNVAQVVLQVLTDWLEHGDQEKGQISTANLQSAVASAGGNPADINHLDMNALYGQACQNAGLPQPPPYSGPAPIEHIVKEISYHNEYNDYSHNENVNNNLNVLGNVDGDLNYDPVTATGGSVAGGGDVTGATNGGVAGSGTGDVVGATGGSQAAGGNIQTASGGSTLVGGDNFGNANSGDHASQIGGTAGLFGGGAPEPILTRELDTQHVPGLGGGPITVNTGDGTQQVSNDSGDGNHNVHFGSGSDTVVQGSTLDNSAVGQDHVFGGNTASQGGAVGDNNETHNYQDDSTHTNTATVNGLGSGSDPSPFVIDQGDGTHHDTADAGIHVHIDHPDQPDHIMPL